MRVTLPTVSYCAGPYYGPDIPHIFTVRRDGGRQAHSFQSFQQRLDFGFREHACPERFYVSNKPGASGHIRGHRRLEGAVADKGDDGVDGARGGMERSFEGLDVFGVLPQGVLEGKGFFEHGARPPGVVFRTVDPAFPVFGFQDKDAEGGQDDVVYLGGAVVRGQGDIVHGAVGLFWEPQPCHQADV